MLTKKECFIIAIIILIITISLNLTTSFIDDWMIVLGTLLAITLVVLANIFSKKIIAFLLDSEIEMKVWEWKKFGFQKNKIAGKSFPIGAILPIISLIIFFPFKSLVWMGSLIFDTRPRIYRGAKRFGLYAFSDLTEYHLGLIAASGVIINLILSVVGYFLGFQLFSRLNIYYAFFNMLPISELDGNKIFFGNMVLWGFLASLVLIGMLFAIFVI